MYIPHFYYRLSAFNFYTAFPREHPAWQAVFLTYNYQVWLGLAISCIVIIPFMKLLSKNYSFMDIGGWIFYTLTGKGSTIPIGNAQVTLTMTTWSISALVLSYAFTSSLISSLTKPAVEKPMRTWQDLLNNDYIILTAWHWYDGVNYPSTHFDNYIKVVHIIITSSLSVMNLYQGNGNPID